MSNRLTCIERIVEKKKRKKMNKNENDGYQRVKQSRDVRPPDAFHWRSLSQVSVPPRATIPQVAFNCCEKPDQEVLEDFISGIHTDRQTMVD